ncbi:MAG: hypothetical protein M1836_005481 [Candelina mexicana]|nr:MAG: hypothetical protein M1836_005481 [Candelina mexicana]
MIRRRLYSVEPPPARTEMQDKTTLLVSWWCTCFALTIVLVRLVGRYIRSERLFREDKVMTASIVPLMLRMACVHVVLIFGTNNAITTGFSADQIHRREIGSRLVLASRIMYAAFLWICKFSVSEFLHRLIKHFWRKSYAVGLRIVRWTLAITFLAVVIGTLAECHPFHRYWQVVPDPGSHCRSGFAQLIAMGTCDVITDLLLVIFPIPIIIRSQLDLTRLEVSLKYLSKIKLILLFALPLGLVAITTYRVPTIIDRQGSQQYRTLLASFETLAAAAAANALVLGSFVRDRGVKKQKFKLGSTNESMDRQSNSRRSTKTANSWGSDEDLVRGMGIRCNPELRANSLGPRPPPMARPASRRNEKALSPVVDLKWQFPSEKESPSDTDSEKDTLKNSLSSPPRSPGDVSIRTARRMSFFDVGGLLEDGMSHHSTSPTAPTFSSTMPPPTYNPSRRGSRALITDMGGYLSPGTPKSPRHDDQVSVNSGRGSPRASVEGLPKNKTDAVLRPKRETPTIEGPGLQTLQDVGGLFAPGSPKR